jgi:hypothetical protein
MMSPEKDSASFLCMKSHVLSTTEYPASTGWPGTNLTPVSVNPAPLGLLFMKFQLSNGMAVTELNTVSSRLSLK